ncbi:unnamed protein product [Parnassius apollo]|uniref:(apollo) hypothetical protein n=1 Tax=Parnassius apollo TaxID=110799 RepID=A0A8S3XNJ1_PARAO|nr:unnamed protein product [Parnassius apollo]
METVYPAAASALARGRRRRQATPRSRHRTAPVTFAEIKEVDEEQEVVEEADISLLSERRRKPDELLELSREFAEFRRRRARRTALREPDEIIENPSPSDGLFTSNVSSSSEIPSVAAVDVPHEVPVVSKPHGQLTRSSSEPT